LPVTSRALLAPAADLLELERHGDERVGGRAVLGDRARRRAVGERHDRGRAHRDGAVDPLGVAGDPRAVGGRQAALAPVDDQAAGRLALREALVEQLLDLGRLGARGQEARGVVAGDVGELGRERREGQQGDDPCGDDDPLGPASGDEACESGHAPTLTAARCPGQVGLSHTIGLRDDP
jgi:hypothetical protein